MPLSILCNIYDNAQKQVWSKRILQNRGIETELRPSYFKCNRWIHSIHLNINGNKFTILVTWRLRHIFEKRCFQLQLFCVDHCPFHRSLIHSHGSRDLLIIRDWLECNEELATIFVGCILRTHRFTWRNPNFPFWCIQRIWNWIYLFRIGNICSSLLLREKHWLSGYAHPSLQHWNLNDDFHWVPEYIFNNCTWSYEWNFPWGSHKI